MAKEAVKQPDDEVDISCGIWKFRTNVFGRKFSNLYVFTILMSTTIMLSKMVHEIIPVQLKYMQRQFNIDNQQVGMLQTARMAGHMATLFWAGHFVKGMHVPITIGIAAILEGFALSVPAVIQFMDPYELDFVVSITNISEPTSPAVAVDEYLCSATAHASNKASMGVQASSTSVQYTALLIASAVTGAMSIFQSGMLGNLYIDDNAHDKAKIPIFFGIRSIIWAMAKPAGTTFNGVIAEIPVDLKSTTLDPNDTRFVSAWWLAYLLFGLAGILNALPLMAMPRRLISKKQQLEAIKNDSRGGRGAKLKKMMAKDGQKTKTNEESRDPDEELKDIPLSDVEVDGHFAEQPSGDKGRRMSLLYPTLEDTNEHRLSIASIGKMPKELLEKAEEKEEDTKAKNENNFWVLLKDFPVAIVRLLTIPQFSLILLEIAMIAVPMMGINIFRNNYMNFEFNVPMAEVAYYTSITTVVSAIFGIVASSWIATKVTSQMGYLWIMFFTYLIGSVIVPFYLMLGCDNQPIFGLNDTTIGRPINMSQLACNCTQENPLISCGDDNNNYLSPCYAGCSLSDDGTVFKDCHNLLNNETGTTVKSGVCDVPGSCYTNFLIYVILHGLQKMVEEMNHIPRTMFLLRLVDPRDRALGLSLFGVVFTLSSIPAPSIFGKIYDGMCLVHKGHVCDFYDRDAIRLLIGGVDVGVHSLVQVVIVLLLLITWCQNKKQQKLKDEEEANANKRKASTARSMTGNINRAMVDDE